MEKKPSHPSISSDHLTNIFYGDSDALQRSIKLRALKISSFASKINTSKLPPHIPVNITEEAATLFHLITLHRKGDINLVDDFPSLCDFTVHSRALELHFNIFRTTCLLYSGKENHNVLKSMIDEVKILGSVLLEEFDSETGIVDDDVKTIATYDNQTKKLILNTPPNVAKFCRFYSHFSTHVVIFARIKLGNRLSAPYPFFVQLRNPKTFELEKGIREEWVGPTMSSRQYLFHFENFEIAPEQLMLDKFLNIKERFEFHGDDEVLDYYRKVCLLRQQSEDMSKSVRDCLRMANLSVRFLYSDKYSQPKGKPNLIMNYTKTKMLEVMAELLNLLFTTNELRKVVKDNTANIQKDFVFLNELFPIHDAYEVFINQRCLANVEILRNTLSSIGFLRFCGLEYYIETARQNVINLGINKDIRYCKLADELIQTNMERKGEFLQIYAPLLTERDETNVYARVPKFESNRFILNWLLGRKVIDVKRELMHQEIFQASQDFRKFLKTIPDIRHINDFCETFLSYLTQSIALRNVESHLDNLDAEPIHCILLAYAQKIALDDLPRLLFEEQSVLVPHSSVLIKIGLNKTFMVLGRQKTAMTILESLCSNENTAKGSDPVHVNSNYEGFVKDLMHSKEDNTEKIVNRIRMEVNKFLGNSVTPKI